MKYYHQRNGKTELISFSEAFQVTVLEDWRLDPARKEDDDTPLRFHAELTRAGDTRRTLLLATEGQHTAVDALRSLLDVVVYAMCDTDDLVDRDNLDGKHTRYWDSKAFPMV